MATDVDVQYFSHLNGLTLGNNWGDLIRLLDKALVTGIDFTQITAASIDAQGDVHITLYAAHNAMLFQVVELSGFAPASLNQKYRIKGVPNTTQLILKPHTTIAETSITTIGAGKLASLGYDIIFRDANDVKRVYRAKNPTSQHPFIRVDESLASDTGSYTATYAKYAMVGLLEHMDHIDDFENPDVLQLPFNPSDPAKNWKITGTGTAVVRGWSRWYWACSTDLNTNSIYLHETTSPANANRAFTIVGDKDAFYIDRSVTASAQYKTLLGCGLLNESIGDTLQPTWFLASFLKESIAGNGVSWGDTKGAFPLISNANRSSMLTTKQSLMLENHTFLNPVVPNYSSGGTAIFSATSCAAMEIPVYDDTSLLRGTMKHVMYAGATLSVRLTTPLISNNSMYVVDSGIITGATEGGFYFYLGEIE